MAESRPCSLSALSQCRGALKKKENFTPDDWLFVKARSSIPKIRWLCEHHSKVFLDFYVLKQVYCCDPQGLHKKRVQGFHAISIREYKASKSARDILNAPLVPGKKLCNRCSSKILPLLSIYPEIEDSATSSFTSSQSSRNESQSTSKTEPSTPKQHLSTVVEEWEGPLSEAEGTLSEREDATLNQASQDFNTGSAVSTPEEAARVILRPGPEPSTSHGAEADEESETTYSQSLFSGDETYCSSGEAIAKVDASLKAIEESPINKRKLATAPTYGPGKLMKAESKMRNLLLQGGAAISTSVKTNFCEKVVTALLDKFKNSSASADKIAVLSVALAGLSQAKVKKQFGPLGASDFLIRKTVKLTSEQGLFPKPLPKKGRSLSYNIITLVQEHYESERYSRQLPGKKDYVIVIKDGEKVYVQKKMVLCTLSELYQCFKDNHPAVKVSFSKFASLRPRHCIFAGSAGTHSICVCKYHQNVKLMYEAVDFKSLDASLETYKVFLHAGMCPVPSAECYLQNCHNCPGYDQLEDNLTDLFQANCIDEISFKQWSDVERSTLHTETMETGPFLESFKEKLKELAPHRFITKQQAQYLQDQKEDLKLGESLTICDFSENYTFIIQDSIQGYYFRNDQATLHPFATYYKAGGELKCLSYVVISDYMKHNVTSFYSFQKKRIEHLKTLIPELQKIVYFSDGAGSQYKNVFNIQNVTHHEEDFGVKCEWMNFATSHGKGPADGIGGTLKRYAARASLQGKLIRSPFELYTWAKDAMHTITVAYVSTREVLDAEAFLQRRFQAAVKIDKIRTYHRFTPLSIGEVEVRRYSNSEEAIYAPVELVRKVPPFTELDIGTFIAVHSTGKSWCVAQVTNTDLSSKQIMASRLEESGKSGSEKCSYQLPDDESEEPIDQESILAVIQLMANRTANKTAHNSSKYKNENFVAAQSYQKETMRITFLEFSCLF